MFTKGMENHSSECRCHGTGLVKVMGTLYACPVRPEPDYAANPRFGVIERAR